MRVNDAAADGLEIEHAGVGGQVRAYPRGAVSFEPRAGTLLHHPIIEGTRLGGDRQGVSAPRDLTPDDSEVGTDLFAGQDSHPKIAHAAFRLVVAFAEQYAAARSHASQVDDGLAKDRIPRRRCVVEPALETLRPGNQQLVVNPSMSGVEIESIDFVGRNAHAVVALNWHVNPRIGMSRPLV